MLKVINIMKTVGQFKGDKVINFFIIFGGEGGYSIWQVYTGKEYRVPDRATKSTRDKPCLANKEESWSKLKSGPGRWWKTAALEENLPSSLPNSTS